MFRLPGTPQVNSSCNGVDALLDLIAIDGVVFGGNSQP